MQSGDILINGGWAAPRGGDFIPVMNPSDGSEMDRIGRGQAEDIDAAVGAAREALDGDWGRMTAAERGRVMMDLGRLILEHVDELSVLEARDVGKPMTQARNDVIACARYMEFYGGAADKVHGETIPYLDGYTVLTVREPHGVTGHIIPWNYPLQIIGRSIGAALAMGNACVLKPGEDASLTSIYFAKLAMDAGLPAGALNLVTGYGDEAGAALSAHPGIDHISFTGSPQAGTLVQKAAADNIVPVTLELGGKSPQVVFADADFDAALPFVVNASIQNAGQTCSAGSRLLIEDSAYDSFVLHVAERFAGLRVGSAEQDLDVGPLINPTQLGRVNAYLDRARADGLPILAQGEMAPNAPTSGNYVLPTVIGEVPPDHALAQEEIFGPVLVVIRFKDEDDAIRIANGTEFGLVGGVWTRDGGRQMRLARKVRTGQVFINNYGAGGGVELPFGGMKHSGYGREKGFEALYGFSVTKTIAIKHD